MNAKIRKKLARRKQRIAKRLEKSDLRGCCKPMFTASNIQYEIGERGRGVVYGGIGAMQLLVRKLGLAEAIDDRLELLKIHLPYHESDHVLNLAYNALCDGTCLEDIELRRKERRLESRGLHYRDVTEPSRLDGALDTLFDLHRARWREEASRWFAGQEPFQRAFSRIALERGWLRLRILELDGRAAAVYHGFRLGPGEWSHQFGRDPAYDELSVGLLLTAHAVRRAFEEGAAEFHLGPGGQPYKFRFATDDPGLETIGIASGVRGWASLFAERRRSR